MHGPDQRDQRGAKGRRLCSPTAGPGCRLKQPRQMISQTVSSTHLQKHLRMLLRRIRPPPPHPTTTHRRYRACLQKCFTSELAREPGSRPAAARRRRACASTAVASVEQGKAGQEAWGEGPIAACTTALALCLQTPPNACVSNNSGLPSCNSADSNRSYPTRCAAQAGSHLHPPLPCRCAAAAGTAGWRHACRVCCPAGESRDGQG